MSKHLITICSYWIVTPPPPNFFSVPLKSYTESIKEIEKVNLFYKNPHPH